MATGDSDDMLARLVSLLPSRWFSHAAPLRDALLGGVADSLAWCYALYADAKNQTRIATATGYFLDMISWDFLGGALRRRGGQGDDSFRAEIVREIFRARASRPAMVAAIADLTGVAPIVFEPANPHDTGVWTTGGRMGWSMLGRWGSMQHPHECWIDLQRPLGQGIPGVNGYGGAAAGYGAGRGEWVSLAMVAGPITDTEIYRTVERIRPVGTTCWVRISDALPPPDLASPYDYLADASGLRLVLDDHSGVVIGERIE